MKKLADDLRGCAPHKITMEEVLRDLREKPTVPVWPHLSMLLGISRGSAFAAVKNGEIDILEVGARKLVVTASLRKRLQIT